MLSSLSSCQIADLCPASWLSCDGHYCYAAFNTYSYSSVWQKISFLTFKCLHQHVLSKSYLRRDKNANKIRCDLQTPLGPSLIHDCDSQSRKEWRRSMTTLHPGNVYGMILGLQGIFKLWCLRFDNQEAPTPPFKPLHIPSPMSRFLAGSLEQQTISNRGRTYVWLV